jgi:DNA polymerase-3 subunit epsilon
MREKIILLDVETTGLNSYNHSIHQLSGYIGEELDDVINIRRSFDVRMKPFRMNTIQDEALEVAGITLEILKGYQDAKVAHAHFTHTLDNFVDKFNKQDKFHLLAYNAPFDTDFLRKWFLDNGNKFYGSYFFAPSIDVMTLAASSLMETRGGMSNFKLATVATTIGIEVDESRLHDSMYDIQLTLEIYAHIKNKKLSINIQN